MPEVGEDVVVGGEQVLGDGGVGEGEEGEEGRWESGVGESEGEVGGDDGRRGRETFEAKGGFLLFEEEEGLLLVKERLLVGEEGLGVLGFEGEEGVDCGDAVGDGVDELAVRVNLFPTDTTLLIPLIPLSILPSLFYF